MSNKVPPALKGCRIIETKDKDGDIRVNVLIGGMLHLITYRFSWSSKNWMRGVPQDVTIKDLMNSSFYVHYLEDLLKIGHKKVADFIVA